MSSEVEEFGTGFLRTAISRDADGYRWERRPGPARGGELGSPTAELRAAVAGLGTPGLVLPALVGSTRRYLVPGRVTAAKVVLGPDAGPNRARLEAALHGVGSALRVMHQQVPARLATRRPPGPARLAAWLEHGTGPAAAAQLHQVFRRRLGAQRWDRVLAWCRAMAAPQPGDVFLHGAPSLGSVVLGADDRSWCLLTGEECASGPAGFDLGWLLGEFAEWQMMVEHAGPGTLDPEVHHRVRAALLRGHGPVADAALVGRVAVVRFFTHAHDFAAYMGWHPQLHVYGEQIAELIDEEGAGAVRQPQRV